MEESLRSSFINRGADNVFCNQGDGNGNNNNIERIDYIFEDGYPLHDNLGLRGFLVMDRSGTTTGNDAFQLAAITGLGTNGLPSSFSTGTVSIAIGGWGDSGVDINTTVMRGYTENGDVLHPSADVTVQNIVGAYITWLELGLQTNQMIYGYSLRGNDMVATLAWTNLAAYPLATDSGGNGGGLDLISGGAMFFDANFPPLGDFVWDDWNGNGIQDAGEPGLSNVLVKVYDASTNLAGLARTDSNGYYQVVGLTPDSYFVEFLVTNTYPQYSASPADFGTNDALDSDAFTNTWRTATFALSAGQSNQTIDCGAHLPATDVGVTKTVNNNHPNIRDAVTYTIGVTNNGPYSADFVLLTDTLPYGVTFSNAVAGQGTFNSTSGVWNVGTLTNGRSAQLTITGTINTNMGGIAITNTVSLTQMSRPDSNHSNDTASAGLTVQITDLAVTKTVNNSAPRQGSNIVYTIVVTNLGPDAATQVVLNELPMTNWSTFVSAAPSTGLYNNVTGVWSNFNLAVSNSATLNITVAVNTNTAGRTFTNTVTVMSRVPPDTNSANDSASATITVAAADLAVTKSVNPAGANEGSQVIYTIAVTNLGPTATSGVQIRDPLTNTVTYVTNSASQGSYASGSGIWTVGSLGVGGGATLSITATVNAGTAGRTITNISVITGSDLPDPNPGNNTSTAVLGVTSIKMTKTSDVATYAYPGSNITYTIVVTNSGATVHQILVCPHVRRTSGIKWFPGGLVERHGPCAVLVEVHDHVRDTDSRNNSMKSPISVIVLTFNEAVNIADCINAVAWADDVIVVDSGSTDDTLALAREARADVRVFRHAFQDFGDQRNWALDNIAPEHDGVLFLDADEHITPPCAEAICHAVEEEGCEDKLGKKAKGSGEDAGPYSGTPLLCEA